MTIYYTMAYAMVIPKEIYVKLRQTLHFMFAFNTSFDTPKPNSMTQTTLLQ